MCVQNPTKQECEGWSGRAEVCCLLCIVALATLFISNQTKGLVLCGIHLLCLHTFSQAQSRLYPYPAFSLATSWCTTKLLHWLWSKKGIYLKSVCEGVIIQHHSADCWDFPASWLGTSTLLYFSGQDLLKGWPLGLLSVMFLGFTSAATGLSPVHGEQPVLLRAGRGGQQVLPTAWYISTQQQGENK